LYYTYSFCNDLAPYLKELEILHSIIPTNTIVIPNAKSMPFSFALSKSKRIITCFEERKYLFMLLAFLEEQQRFLRHLKTLVPFDENFLNFAMNNTKEIDPWNEAVLFYNLNYFSKQLCSFDGPFDEEQDFDSFQTHLSRLTRINKRRFDVKFEETPPGFKLYEFPNPNTHFDAGSVVITNRIIPELDLLFEDKLKIYGV
tara:strand:+ start:553 stop:1152 length:600 start_codon:yes stop_codon:yes gene_type:complete